MLRLPYRPTRLLPSLRASAVPSPTVPRTSCPGASMHPSPLSVLSALALGLLLAGPLRADAADEVDAAEAARLTAELHTLAGKNAWAGVERTYDQLLDSGARVERDALLVAAEAARHRGDVLSRMVRLVEAHYREADPELASTIEALETQYGRVQLSGEGTLQAAKAPFRPDARQSIAFAQEQLAEGDAFDGYLPVGSYTFAERTFDVQARAPTVVVTTLKEDKGLTDLTLKGVAVPRRATVGGRRLKLNGVGRRTKIGVTVYVGALYLQEPTTDAAPAIRQDLPKRITMDFVYRKTPRDAITGAFKEGFAKVVSSDALDGRIESFVRAVDRDMARGDRLVMDYIPGIGTLVSLNGREVVRVEGRPFMWALWELFLGEDPPTEGLREGMLGKGG